MGSAVAAAADQLKVVESVAPAARERDDVLDLGARGSAGRAEARLAEALGVGWRSLRAGGAANLLAQIVGNGRGAATATSELAREPSHQLWF